MSEKICPDCSRLKPLDAFPRNETMKLGVNTYCRPCASARAKRSNQKKRLKLREARMAAVWALARAVVDAPESDKKHLTKALRVLRRKWKL